MASPVPPDNNCRQLYPGMTVSDIEEAISFYTEKLGFSLRFRWGNPTDMAGLNFNEASVHLFQNLSESASGKVYFEIDNADEWYTFHKGNGVNIVSPIADKPYDMRDYHIMDPFGNILGFGQYKPSRAPGLKIKRVELTVRLEERIASLITDLAAHKQMNIGEMLEETLLHTFEPYGEGVASPHTKATLQYIQELKRKHGIDYDVHASYRFVE